MNINPFTIENFFIKKALIQGGGRDYHVHVLDRDTEVVSKFVFSPPNKWSDDRAIAFIKNEFIPDFDQDGIEGIKEAIKWDGRQKMGAYQYLKYTFISELSEFLRQRAAVVDQQKQSKPEPEKEFEDVNSFVLHVREKMKLQVSFTVRHADQNGCVIVVAFTNFKGESKAKYELFCPGRNSKEAKLVFANTKFKEIQHQLS